MLTTRTRIVLRHEFVETWKKPLFRVLVFLLVLTSWGFSSGGMQIQSGDTTVGGGARAWVTSEFSFALLLTFLVPMLYGFFGSIASGVAILSDDEARISDMLLSTPLTPSEYVWGKFLGIFGASSSALGVHLLATFFFYHAVPDPTAAEIHGPFDLLNYLRPALVFALPTLVFYLGVAFFLGERWRRPITVFLFPTAVMMLDVFFLRSWGPTWLDSRVNQLLMLVDPSGYRWLNETWLELDRGVEVYNTTRIGLDAPFVISRLAFLGIGLLGVRLAERHLAAHFREKSGSVSRLLRSRPSAPPQADAAVAPFPRPLEALQMAGRPVGLFRGAATVAVTELKNLLASPGLYLFGVLIVILTVSNSLLTFGAFGEELILTPGKLA
ncbi:MAG TPA: ABC transporter permease subunit, partial [Thermoanaerobaculia bacterium]|nr:ABC transporter permease subunit [Thermoanaerobaculia bacterium]